jgi:hypothetical protein
MPCQAYICHCGKQVCLQAQTCHQGHYVGRSPMPALRAERSKDLIVASRQARRAECLVADPDPAARHQTPAGADAIGPPHTMVPPAPAIAAAVNATIPVLVVAVTAVDVVTGAVMTAAIMAPAVMHAAVVAATMRLSVMATAAVPAAMMATAVMPAAMVAAAAMLGDCRAGEHQSPENREDQGELA